MAHASNGFSALQRHLRVLDAFDAWHPFLSLSEIARSADLPVSSVHRLVGELVTEGLLERTGDRDYRLGIRLWELASRTPGALGLREVARPHLQAVQDCIRQHTQLGVLSDDDVLFIERLSAPTAVVNATLIGARMPAHRTASGQVLLAYAESRVVDASTGERHDEHGDALNEAASAQLLRRVRHQGFAVTSGMIHPASRGIAVPIMGSRGEPHAAISVIVPNDDKSPEPFVEILHTAAERISRALESTRASDSARRSGDAGVPVYSGLPQASVRYLRQVSRTSAGPNPFR